MKRISLNLSENEYQVLKELAEENRIMLVSLIRMIVTDFVKNNGILEIKK